MNADRLLRLDGRVVVLTGAAGLLGREYAKALVEAGASVALVDIDAPGLERTAGGVAGSGRVLTAVTDVSDAASVSRMMAAVLDQFGRVDILVNNAAIDPKVAPGAPAGTSLRFEDFPLDLWQQALSVNVTGMFLCARAAARPMLAQKGGIIINVSSIYGMLGPDQRLYESPDRAAVFVKPVTYSVTKSAVFGLTNYLSTYFSGQGIRVNTLTLGGVQHEQDESFVQRYSQRTPMGRMARKDEYCGALLFLASDASSYMTGANLVVDGGWSAW